MQQIWKITYMARSGNEDDCEVRVDATPEGFYATNLRLWGCGKTRSTPEEAIRALVRDIATILHMERVS